MLNLDNPNFERPNNILRENTCFDVERKRFSASKSYDGFVGGPPLAYDRENRKVAVDSSDDHTLVYGATGSKKTRCIVMPSIRILGYAGESMILNDAKGELYRSSAGFLQEQGYHVVTLNFREPSSGDCWNFMEIPYQLYKAGNVDKACEYVADIANTISPVMDAKDPFWAQSASSCLYGLILCLFRYCRERALPDEAVNIANLLTLRREMFRKTGYSRVNKFWQWAQEDMMISSSLIGTVETASDTQKGILSTLDVALNMFVVSPSLVEMVSHNTFEINSIVQQKTAVFLITPDEKTTYHRLVSLFISQSYQQLVRLADHTDGRLSSRVNYILDEFSALPAVGGSDMAQYLAAGRSRNLRFLICLQSKNQLVHTYKENAETITANCTNWIFLFSRELDLLRDISALCGEKRDHTPNLSVYDLQQLDKEHDQALLLSARRKPAIVNLLDISGYAPASAVPPVRTPERRDCIRLEFKEMREEERPIDLAGMDPFKTGEKPGEKLDLDAMLADIDAKIAAIDKEEAEKARQEAEKAAAPSGTESEE